MAEPKVVGVVLNFNGERFLPDCLDSLGEQTYRNLDILVVDNASTDGSPELINERYQWVKLVVNKCNLMFAGGNNVGIRYALDSMGADLVLLLNNDIKCDPAMVEKLVGAIESDDLAGMAGPKIYYWDRPDLIWSAGGALNLWTGNTSHIGLRETDNGQYDTLTYVDYLTACALLVRRDVIEEIGLLDEAFPMYSEDADWCRRAVEQSYRCLYVPEARMWHRISASSGGNLSRFKLKRKLMGNLRLLRKHADPWQWPSIVVAMSIRTLWQGLKSMVGGRFSSLITSLMALLGFLPRGG
jgi:GT2 family glycosyltransferase